MAVKRDGTYDLTHHRFARREKICLTLSCQSPVVRLRTQGWRPIVGQFPNQAVCDGQERMAARAGMAPWPEHNTPDIS